MLKNKSIVITGANRGIGKSIAIECAKNGADLYLCSRIIDVDFEIFCSQLHEQFHSNIKSVQLDLSDEDSIKNASSEILGDKSNIYGLVNNAGIVGFNKLFSMTTMSEIRHTFEINFFGGMFFSQRLLKRIMKNKDGSIVNISSISAIKGYPGQFEYVTSKAAIIGATRQLAVELGQFGIRVNAVAPGITDTDMVSTMTPDLRCRTIEHSVLKRILKTEEIADSVVFLLSDKSKAITGQVFSVDGGML